MVILIKKFEDKWEKKGCLKAIDQRNKFAMKNKVIADQTHNEGRVIISFYEKREQISDLLRSDENGNKRS